MGSGEGDGHDVEKPARYYEFLAEGDVVEEKVRAGREVARTVAPYDDMGHGCSPICGVCREDDPTVKDEPPTLDG
jgi:hypothetical protein